MILLYGKNKFLVFSQYDKQLFHLLWFFFSRYITLRSAKFLCYCTKTPFFFSRQFDTLTLILYQIDPSIKCSFNMLMESQNRFACIKKRRFTSQNRFDNIKKNDDSITLYVQCIKEAREKSTKVCQRNTHPSAPQCVRGQTCTYHLKIFTFYC